MRLFISNSLLRLLRLKVCYSDKPFTKLHSIDTDARLPHTHCVQNIDFQGCGPESDVHIYTLFL